MSCVQCLRKYPTLNIDIPCVTIAPEYIRELVSLKAQGAYNLRTTSGILLAVTDLFKSQLQSSEMLCRGSSAPRQTLILSSAISKPIFLRLMSRYRSLKLLNFLFCLTSSKFYTFIIVIVRYSFVLYQFYVNCKGSCKKLKPLFKDHIRFSRTTY